MESLHKNIQLMLKFVKAPFLVLHFSFYTLMTFLTMVSVILLSTLMMLISILSVIRHLIYGNNFNWLLNLNLIYKTLWTGVRSGLLITMLGKVNWFRLTGLKTMVLWMDGFVVEEKPSFKILGWIFSSKLDWCLKLSLLLKLAAKKLEL